MTAPAQKLRLDKWLWQARFFKTRTLASKIVSGGQVQVNSERVRKASFGITCDDVLTFAQGNQLRVIRILALGKRRGPAPEAQALYQDLSPEPEKKPEPVETERVGGRPTKRDRRALDALRRGDDPDY